MKLLLFLLGDMLSFRERLTFSRISTYRSKLFDTLKKGATWGQVSAILLVIAQLWGAAIFGGAIDPLGERLDMHGYSLVFEDEFDGDALDTSKWEYRASGARRSGFNAPSQVRVEDGNLIMKAEYLKADEGAYGEGWYAGMIKATRRFRYGYYEMKCICSEGGGFWSAFWIQASNPYTPEISKGGRGGAELDIFEAFNYNDKLKYNSVSQNIHCSGKVGDDSGNLNSLNVGNYNGKNIYKEYNTYGLEWTPTEYIFYINGVETARTSFADGTSEVEEDLIISLELPGEFSEKPGFECEFKVDYVKVYQKIV